MWRKLTLVLTLKITSMLLLMSFAVAQIATASPIPGMNNNGAVGHEKSSYSSQNYYISESPYISQSSNIYKNPIINQGPAKSETPQTEQKTAVVSEKDGSEDLFNLPRLNRLSPVLFSADKQTTPNYVLLVEFFKSKLTAGVFKNLANPPLITLWFEQLSHNTNSSRLSGWKDGNSLYKSRTTYHS